jgi:hypothetical protein
MNTYELIQVDMKRKRVESLDDYLVRLLSIKTLLRECLEDPQLIKMLVADISTQDTLFNYLDLKLELSELSNGFVKYIKSLKIKCPTELGASRAY